MLHRMVCCSILAIIKCDTVYYSANSTTIMPNETSDTFDKIRMNK